MKKIAIVYHRIDFDGICSYAVVRRHLEENPRGGRITPVPYTHGDPVPNLSTFDLVYVADICLPDEVMVSLMDSGRLVWIDHHATSIDASVAAGYDGAPGLRRVGVGACELCWEYLFTDEAPKVVRYLSAYDVFDKGRFDWDGTVLPFQYGMRNRIALDANLFCSMFGALCKAGPGGILKEGRAILSYVRSTGRISCGAYGFEVRFAGRHKALCLLTATFGSIPMEETARERGCDVVLCVNRIDAGKYKVSAYSPFSERPVHLGNYFRDTYGGGGHAGAAGCVIGQETFLRLLNEKVL